MAVQARTEQPLLFKGFARNKEFRIDKLSPNHRNRDITRIVSVELIHYRLVAQ